MSKSTNPVAIITGGSRGVGQGNRAFAGIKGLEYYRHLH